MEEPHKAQTSHTTRIMQGPAISVLLAMLLLILASACGQADTTSPTSPFDTSQPPAYGGSYAGGNATGDTQAGADFARWVLDQDPNRQYLTDAVVRNEQSLGVKVQPTITKAQLQTLLMALAQGMAKTFPGKDLTVIAFYQSGDKLAQADYSYQTGQTNVQFYR